MNQMPEEALRAYVKAFETLAPDAVAPFYNVPCLFVSPQGTFAVSDPDGTRAMASQLIEQARAQRYRRTEILQLEVRRLAPTLASLTGVFVRYDVEDVELIRFGFAYTMLGTERGWRIVVAIAHDPPAPRP